MKVSLKIFHLCDITEYQCDVKSCNISQDCSVKRVFIHHFTPNVPPNSIMAKDLDTGEYTRMDNCKYTTYL